MESVCFAGCLRMAKPAYTLTFLQTRCCTAGWRNSTGSLCLSERRARPGQSQRFSHVWYCMRAVPGLGGEPVLCAPATAGKKGALRQPAATGTFNFLIIIIPRTSSPHPTICSSRHCPIEQEGRPSLTEARKQTKS